MVKYSSVIFSTIVFLSIVTFATIQDNSDAVSESFECDGMTYSIKYDGTVQLEYIADTELEVITIPDTAVNKDDGISYNVSSIADCIIAGWSVTREVIIGNNVEYIGFSNIQYLPSLEKIKLGSSVETIARGCFVECPSLITIDTDSNPNFSFNNGLLYNTAQSTLCCVLDSVEGEITIDSKITRIGEYAASGCTKLTSVIVSDNLFCIDDYAFLDCTSLEHISSYDVSTGLVSPDTFPYELIVINAGAFYNCTSLKDFDFEINLNVIDCMAFYNCINLSTVTIPPSLSYIGTSAFEGCVSIEAFHAEESTTFHTQDGVLYKKAYGNDVAELVFYPSGKRLDDGVFCVLSGTTSIESGAFAGCGDLTEVILPSTVTYLAPYAFMDCTSLKKINIPDSLFYINTMVFFGCTSLETVTMHDEVMLIGYNAFQGCTSLSHIDLPSGLETILCQAFQDCTSLKEIVIPASVRSVMELVFANSGLREITLEGNETVFATDSLSISPTDKCTLTIHCNEGVSISKEAFGDMTAPTYSYFEKVPYPYENWIAIAICIVFMIFLVKAIRRV